MDNIDKVEGLQDALDLKADKATTLAGYGITDAYTKTVINDSFYNKTQINDSFYNKSTINSTFSKLASSNTFTAYNAFNRPATTREFTDDAGNIIYTEPYYQTAIDVQESELRVKHIDNLIWSTDEGMNQGFTVSNDSFASLPMNNYWHDLFGFASKATPTYETSTNGTTWTTATVDKRLFNQKMKQSVPVLTSSSGTNICGARWTWSMTNNDIMYGNGYWLCLGRCWSSEWPTVRVLVEYSDDNSAWTTLIDKTIHKAKGNATPLYFRSNKLTAKAYLRLTISKDPNTTAYFNLSSIKLLSDRWGDQGQGTELEFPYDWDENKQIILQNHLYPVADKSYNLGTISKRFNGVYSKLADLSTSLTVGSSGSLTTINSTGISTDGNLVVNGGEIVYGRK